jgi:hypothetical protein
LGKVKDEAERAHVITVECQEAFKALIAKMRFFQDRYFKLPSLTEGDTGRPWVSGRRIPTPRRRRPPMECP